MISFKRVGRLLAAGLALIASSAIASSAQAQTVITGRVTDANGNGIPGANVVIPSLGLGVGGIREICQTYPRQGDGENMYVVLDRETASAAGV